MLEEVSQSLCRFSRVILKCLSYFVGKCEYIRPGTSGVIFFQVFPIVRNQYTCSPKSDKNCITKGKINDLGGDSSSKGKNGGVALNHYKIGM